MIGLSRYIIRATMRPTLLVQKSVVEKTLESSFLMNFRNIYLLGSFHTSTSKLTSNETECDSFQQFNHNGSVSLYADDNAESAHPLPSVIHGQYVKTVGKLILHQVLTNMV